MSTFPHPEPPSEVTPEWINCEKTGYQYWLEHHRARFLEETGKDTATQIALEEFFCYGMDPAGILQKVQEDYLPDTGGTVSGQCSALSALLEHYKGPQR